MSTILFIAYLFPLEMPVARTGARQKQLTLAGRALCLKKFRNIVPLVGTANKAVAANAEKINGCKDFS
jgi:hypothetical protein